MSIKFVDRVSSYPNRYLMTAEDGTQSYITLERADEPTTVGTALNAAILNQFVALSDIKALPNMYLWKKYEGDPSLYTETDVENEAIVSKLKLSSLPTYYPDIRYADTFTVADGEITLVDPKTISSPTVTKINSVQGKYVQPGFAAGGFNTTLIYYIPDDATFSETTDTSGHMSQYRLTVDKAVRIDSNAYLGYVMDESYGTYPTEGTNEDDGYWYVYHKRFGDCNGNITDDQIADAVAAYLEENPIGGGGVTMTQVNNAINSAIGDAIGGSY